jgi:RNA polymerase sigma-70 factor (ECF subfamily)
MNKSAIISYQAIQHPDSSTILQRIAQGDKSAVEDCLNAYGKIIWALTKRFINNREDAEDVVQEVFIDIWKNAAVFDAAKSPERVFIRMITKRRIIDFLRKNYRQPQKLCCDDALEGQASISNKKPSTRLEMQPFFDDLRNLRLEEKQLIDLSVLWGLSHNEIARRLELPVGTVKSRLRRGLKKLQKSAQLRGYQYAAI